MPKIFTRLLIVLSMHVCVKANVYAQAINPLPSTSFSVSTLDNEGGGQGNLYAGQPVISLPLFNYKDNYLTFGIGLSYRGVGTPAGGLASAVGLGWSLNTGGAVRRQVIGLPDEFKYVENGVTKLAGYLNTGTLNTSPSKAELDEINDGKRDGEADRYSFDIPGYSGDIIIDKNNLVVGTIPASDLRISFDRQFNNGRIYMFTIKTPDGLLYTFSSEEIQEFKTKISEVEYSGNYTTTWLLTRIEPLTEPSSTDPTAPFIDIEYSSYTADEIIGFQFIQSTIADAAIVMAMGSACILAHTCCVKSWSYKGEDMKYKGTLQRIDRVKFPNGSSLKFGYSSSRCDMANGKALTSIEYLSPGFLSVKKTLFDYSYGSNAGEVLPGNCSGIDLNKRMLLKKITEQGKYGEVLPPTSFEYEMGIILPDRNVESKRINAWGFADSITSVNQTKAFVIKKISYPTGAFAEYEFEPNVIGWTRTGGIANQTIGGLRIRKITMNEGLGAVASGNEKLEKIYSYDLDGTNSSGQVDYLPFKEIITRVNINKIGGCTIIGGQYDDAGFRTYLSHSPINPFPVANVCGYSKVTEEIRSGAQYLGKNVYYFKNFSDYTSDPNFAPVIGEQAFPYAAKQYHIGWGLGLLRQAEVYTNTDKILKKVECIYNTTATRLSTSNVASQKVGVWYGPANRSGSAVNGDVYKYDTYYPITGITTLTKTTTTDYHYTDGNPTPTTSVEEERKEYVSGKTLVRTIINVESNGDERKTVFYYPFDYSFTAASTTFPGIGILNDRKISTPIVSKESWVFKQAMDRLTDVELQDYALIDNSTVRPSIGYKFKFAMPIPRPQVFDFTPTTIFRNQNIFRESSRLEVYDLKGNQLQVLKDESYRSAVLMDHRFPSAVIAQVNNAKVDEIAYSSFESLPNGPLGQQQIQHNNYLLIGPSFNEGFTGEWSFTGTAYKTLKAGTYQLSYWGKGGQATLSFSNPSGGTFNTKGPVKSFRGWNLYRSIITVSMPTAVLVINCSAFPVDEMKIHPLSATVKTKTYNDYGELVAESDNDNFVYSEYDQFGRNVRTRDVDHHILKQSEYVVQLPPTGFTNRALYGIYKRSCPGNQKSNNVEVAIPAGSYTSALSQYDADMQAEYAAGTYANQNGTCSIVIVIPGDPLTVTVQGISGQSITLNHTPVNGCTSVKIYIKDLTTGATYPPVAGACSGTSTFQLPGTGRKYKFSLITYTTNSPAGVFFDPIEVKVP